MQKIVTDRPTIIVILLLCTQLIGCAATSIYGKNPRQSTLSSHVFGFTVYFNQISSQEQIDRDAANEFESFKIKKGYAAWRVVERKCQNLILAKCDYQTRFLTTEEVSNSGEASFSPPPEQRAQQPKTESENLKEQLISSGTGLFISDDGRILTAAHVVYGKSEIVIKTVDGRIFPAQITALSASTDIALLKVDARAPAYFPVTTKKPSLGDRIFTVGFPVPGLLGQSAKLSEGIVSSTQGIGDDASLMQISVPIQPGNSGGGVITEDGELVGVVSSTAAIRSFIKATGALPQNVSWAVYSVLAAPFLPHVENRTTRTSRADAIIRAERATVFIVAK